MLKGELSHRISGIAANLAYNSVYGATIGDQEILGKLIDGVRQEPDVVLALVADHTGIILAHTDPSKVGTMLSAASSKRTKTQSLSSVEVSFSETLCTAFTPVLGIPIWNDLSDNSEPAEKPVVGWVQIGITLEPLNSQLRKNLGIIAVMFLLATVAGSTMAFVFISRITTPLRQMTAQVVKIAAEYSIRQGIPAETDISQVLSEEVSNKRKDEIAVLGHSFRQMTESLSRYNIARKQAEEDLMKTVSDLEKSHEELKATQMQLIQAEKLESIGRLAAGVAHEVKNPLAIILMGLSYLSKHLSAGGSNIGVTLKQMEDAVNRADSVVKGLLDFSTSRELELNVEELNSIIEQSSLLVKHELVRYHVTLVKELGEALPPTELDRIKMSQVFVNIFMNAIQAMPEGGTITIKTSSKKLREIGYDVGSRKIDAFRIGETVIIVVVEDSGTGITENQITKVFDPFYTTKPTGSGTGLGLSVTKKIIELHKGTIDISNREEGGVRVSIILRATQEG